MKKNNPESSGPATARRRAPSRAAGDGPAAAPGRRKAAPRPFSAEELRRISAHITADWSRPAETRGLTLLEIDPWRVHAYWQVAERDLDAALARLPGGRDAALVLRFTDLSPGVAHEGFDIEVHGAANNWYVDLWRDDRRYVAELGLRAADGTFVALARSNEVQTPRGGPSPELDFRRLQVRAPRAVPAGVPADEAARLADLSGILLRDLFPQRGLPDEGFPLAMAEPSGEALQEPAFPELTAEEPVAAAGRDAHAGGGADFPRIEAAAIEPHGVLARQAQALVLAGMRTHLPPPPAEAIAPSGLELTPRPLPITPSAQTVADRPGGTEADAAPARRGLSNGESAGSMQPPVALEALLAGAVSSPGRGETPLRVSAEVVIRGRGEPASRLRLFGERLRLEADGGFTLRLPLTPGPELAALLRQVRGRQGDRGDG